MNDLERLISERLSQGATYEEIAKDVSNTLNKMRKEVESEKTRLRTDYINSCKAKLKKEEALTIDDVARICLLAVVKKDWDRKKCMDFVKDMEKNIEIQAKITDGEDAAKVFLDEIGESDVWNDLKKWVKGIL